MGGVFQFPSLKRSNNRPDLNLYSSVTYGSAHIRTVTDRLKRTYSRKTRLIGGYWIGQAEYDGPKEEILDLFVNGLFYELRETFGNQVTWQGFIGRMELTIAGLTFVRDMMQCANAVRIIYSRIGDNMLTNGSAESGAWASYNGGASAQSTDWVSEGTYSNAIAAAGVDQGATIQSAVSITAGIGYEMRCSVNVVSGEWKLGVYRDDTGELLTSATADDTGDSVLWCSVSEENTFGGAVSIRLTCNDALGDIYGDGAVFQESPRRAETQWYTNTTSIAQYGRIESIPLRSGMSDDDAQGEAQQLIAANAFPRTLPPRNLSATYDPNAQMRALAPGLFQGGNVNTPKDSLPIKLNIQFFGYVFTLRNLHALFTGTATKTTVVNTIIGESEFVLPGVIETNNADSKVDERAPLTHWEILRALIRAGDASGVRYCGGVYGGRSFNYGPAPDTVTLRYRRGIVLSANQGPIEPWLVAPGICRIDDMPIGPAQAGGALADDPRNVMIEEVEYNMAENSVSLNQDTEGNAI